MCIYNAPTHIAMQAVRASTSSRSAITAACCATIRPTPKPKPRWRRSSASITRWAGPCRQTDWNSRRQKAKGKSQKAKINLRLRWRLLFSFPFGSGNGFGKDNSELIGLFDEIGKSLGRKCARLCKQAKPVVRFSKLLKGYL